MPCPGVGARLSARTRPSARHCAFSWLSCLPRIFGRETVNVFEIGGTRGARVSSRSSPFSAPQRAGPARPVHGLPVPVIALEEAAATLAAVRAPGYEPYDDEDGHRDQPDNDKRLERGEDPACGRDGKPDGEGRAEDCPDDRPISRYAPALLAGGCRAGRECRRSLSAPRQPRLAVTSCESGHSRPPTRATSLTDRDLTRARAADLAGYDRHYSVS